MSIQIGDTIKFRGHQCPWVIREIDWPNHSVLAECTQGKKQKSHFSFSQIQSIYARDGKRVKV